MNETEIMEWLLEKKNPAIRYYALVNLTNTAKAKLAAARKEVMEDQVIKQILARQNEDGSWSQKERFYTDKYRGTIWQLLILAELGASGDDPRIAKACEFVLEHSQDPESMGFAMEMSKKTGHGLPKKVIPCLTGNMVYALIRLGYLDDPRVQKAIDWLVKYQKADDGIESITDLKYLKHEACFGKHTCFMGVVKTLKAFSAIPAKQRSKKVNQKIEKLAEFMLIHHLYKRSHDLEKKAKPGWTRFGFPLMYQTDLLEILEIFTALGIRDERMAEAYQVVINKQQPNGTWKLENTFNGKLIGDIERKNEDSKWITAKALKVLSRRNDYGKGDKP